MPKNFGFGRRLDYAGRQVLQHHFARGHHGSQRTQSERWARLSAWLRDAGIRDMRDVRPEHVTAFADERLEHGVAPRTVANEISAANTVMRHATRNAWTPLSPSKIVGARDDVRRHAPASSDRTVDERARAALAPYPRAAAVWQLARETGMRSQEASLADLDRLSREAKNYGAINVQDGTKGGRDAARWIALSDRAHNALAAARDASPAGSRNLLRVDESYKHWCNGELRAGRDALHRLGVTGFHDARAAYACDRYRDETAREAPAVAGHREAPRIVDRAAREIIARELGHGRTAVTTSYVGSAK